MGANAEIEDCAVEDMNESRKQGHSCCGLCCDMRRAVIIADAINIFCTLMNTVILIGHHQTVTNHAEVDDDLESMEKALTGVWVMSMIYFFLSFASIYGALNFNYLPVALNVLYLLVVFLPINIIQARAARDHDNFSYGPVNWIFSAIATALCIYPHAMFTLEVRSGLMTAESYYTREKQSCCCV